MAWSEAARAAAKEARRRKTSANLKPSTQRILSSGRINRLRGYSKDFRKTMAKRLLQVKKNNWLIGREKGLTYPSGATRPYRPGEFASPKRARGFFINQK